MGDLYDVGAGCELEPVDFQMYRFRATFFLFSSANDRVPIRFLVGAEWDTDGFAPADGSDSDDCAPAWATDFDRSHPYALACISRRGDDSHDLPWDEVAYDMDRCGQFCEVLRPSPGDDITRAAFDELDRER